MLPLPNKKIGAEGEVDRTLASSPTVTPVAHKTVNTGKQSTSKHSITMEQSRSSINKKVTRYIALRHRTYRRERLLTGQVGHRSHTTIPHVYKGIVVCGRC